MRKLLKHMKPYTATIVVIIGFLIVQATCDLSLPSYTSDIVNVGIQQGGIDEKIPEAVTEEEMERLLLFMSREDSERVLEAYELKTADTGYDCEGSVYVLKESAAEDKEEVQELSEILGQPMLLVSGFESDSDTTKQMEVSMKDNMKAAIQSQAEAKAKKAASQMTEEEIGRASCRERV